MDDDATIRQKLLDISETMKDVSIETAKIVGLQTDLCVVKEETKGLVRRVQRLESEVIVLKEENKSLRSDLCVVKEGNKSLRSDLCVVKEENKSLRSDLCVVKEENKSLRSDLCVVKEENKSVRSDLCVVKEENKSLRSDLCVVKEENINLVRKVQQLDSEAIVAKEENKGLVRKVQRLESEVIELTSVNSEFHKQMAELKSDNGGLKVLNNAIIERLSLVEKSLSPSQSSSVFAGQSEESVDKKKVSDCRPSQDSIISQVSVSDEAGSLTVSGGEMSAMSAKESSIIVKKPKAQRKREQEKLFKNFSKTMAGKKIKEKLWASGFLKMSVDQWEGSAGCMQPDELCNFVEKNIGKLLSFASTADSRESLILTLLKIFGDRAVPVEKLKEILDCFVKHGTISEDDVVKFLGMYKI